jgi:Spy/CpxP family protein refolding chaperone
MQMGQGHQMQGMGMMGMTASPSPAAILQQKDALRLSDSQVQSLEALKEEMAEVHKAHMTAAMPLHAEASAALKGDKPDLARYEAALKKLAVPHVQMQVETARFGQKAMEVLTAEQRANVSYGMRLRQGMMGGSGMMGTQGCPMMGGQGEHMN